MQMAMKVTWPYLKPVPEPYDLRFGISDDLAHDNDRVAFNSFSWSRLSHEQWHVGVSETIMEAIAVQILNQLTIKPFHTVTSPFFRGLQFHSTFRAFYFNINNGSYCSMSAESQNCESNREPLLGNGSANTPVARRWICDRHVIAATVAHATIEELWKRCFPCGLPREKRL
jgi:hypothetical protein